MGSKDLNECQVSFIVKRGGEGFDAGDKVSVQLRQCVGLNVAVIDRTLSLRRGEHFFLVKSTLLDLLELTACGELSLESIVLLTVCGFDILLQTPKVGASPRNYLRAEV